MSSAARKPTKSFAAGVTLALSLALAGAGLAADRAGASEGSSAGADAHDGSVFCDPATLPEGTVCSPTPDKEPREGDEDAPDPAAEASTEPQPVSAADPGEAELGAAAEAAGASAPRAGEVASVPLARTGVRAWLPAVLGACLLLGGVGLLVAPRRTRLDR